MYDFTGQECPICKKTFTAADDIVVCPDCGAPYHRDCWAIAQHCRFEAKHAEGFEWQPKAIPKPEPTPAAPAQEASAPGAQQEASAAESTGSSQGGGFDYSQLYGSQYTAPPADAQDNAASELGKDETLEQLPLRDWSSYLGPSDYLYMMVFKQMELMHRKVAVSFSAMVFGPFYFAYRKAWKPCLLLAAATLVVDLPTLLYMMYVSGSPLTAGLSGDFLYRCMAAAGVLSFALMVLRGMYGFYWYKQDCIRRISKIREAYPDDDKRQFVLKAQGGVSWMNVLLLAGGLLALGYCLQYVLGPNLEAVYSLLL